MYPIVTKAVLPQRIVATSGKIDNVENLLKEKDLQASDFEPLASTFYGKCSVVLDFGRELCGGLRIVTGCANKIGTALRIVFGESLSEALSDVGASSATNDHASRDITVHSTMLSDMVYSNTGFRFARVVFTEESYETQVIAIVASATETAQPVEGRFSCDDALLNRIYETAQRTVFLCLQNGYLWDGIKRDRIVWMGDTNPEIRALNCMFASCPNVEASLAFVLRHTPAGGWINNIPSYSMWWIINVYDVWQKTGNEAFVRQYLDEIEKIVGMFVRSVQDGALHFERVAYTQMSFYFDWASYEQEGAEVGVLALMKIALQRAQELFCAFSRDDAQIATLLRELPRCEYRGKLKQIIAVCALAGDLPMAESAARLCEGGAKGFSAFQSYYILKVMAEGGKMAEALACCKEYFGAMLALGATTFWEDFDVAWAENSFGIDEQRSSGKKDIHADFGRHCYVGLRHSLCHGWSSGVLAFLTEYLAGIKPQTAGEGLIAVRPNVCGLERVELVYPTVSGKVRVTVRNGEVHVESDGAVKIV